MDAELEQCEPECARADRGSKLDRPGLRARDLHGTEQRDSDAGARCDSKQEACSEVATPEPYGA